MTIFEVAAKARKAGLSYGKYVQLYGPFDAEPEEGERLCLQCGKPIDVQRIKACNSHFCSDYCRHANTYSVSAIQREAAKNKRKGENKND